LLFAGKGTYTWLFAALAATECTVPAPCLPGLVVTAGTGGTDGKSWTRVFGEEFAPDATTPIEGPIGLLLAVT
jgi:hypothetical protein